MILENQDIRKRRLYDLKQILLRKQYPAEIIDYGVNKALTQTTEELRRVREQATENNLLCLVTTYNPNNPASIPAGQENTSHVEPKLLIKIHYEQD